MFTMEGSKRREPSQRDGIGEPSSSWDGTLTPFEQANYFSSYEFLIHQKEMLEDTVRMEAYHSAITGPNALNFEGKVVLDVGAGTGILAFFAAQAGARKVYAVEATNAAKLAKKLAARNNLEKVVTVIQGTIEEVELPEKVDVIVSEFMGHFLLRESMLDSVLYARDKYLKSGGAIYPSSARMYLAPASCKDMNSQGEAFSEEIQKWDEFLDRTREAYGLNFRCLSGTFVKEADEYFLGTSKGVELEPSELIGPAVCVKKIDLLKASMDDVRSVSQDFTMDISCEDEDKPLLTMFVGWFSVQFDGSPYNPPLIEVECSNEPREDLNTHWGQEAFLVNPPITLRNGDKIKGHFEMFRKPDNWRLYDVNLDYSTRSADGKEVIKHSTQYHME